MAVEALKSSAGNEASIFALPEWARKLHYAFNHTGCARLLEILLFERAERSKFRLEGLQVKIDTHHTQQNSAWS